MKKTPFITAVSIILIVITGALLLRTFRVAPKDELGRSPQSVVEEYLVLARQGEFVRAKEYWGGESTVAHMFDNYEEGEDARFEETCRYYAAFTEYNLVYEGRGKSDTYIVRLDAIENDEVVSSHPFFLMIDYRGKWLIDRWALW